MTFDFALLDVHVALPGKIKSYDSTTQTAEVELQVNMMLPTTQGDAGTERYTDLMNVPIMFPRSKDFFVSFPLAKGDTGLVIFNEMSIDQWRSLGKVCDPLDVARHSVTAPVFVPGLVPNADAIAQDISGDAILGRDLGANVRVKAAAVHVTSSGGTTADDRVALASAVEAELIKIGTALKAVPVTYVPHTVGSDNLYADATTPQTPMAVPDPE
jgi:hypothetical protein